MSIQSLSPEEKSEKSEDRIHYNDARDLVQIIRAVAGLARNNITGLDILGYAVETHLEYQFVISGIFQQFHKVARNQRYVVRQVRREM